MNLNMNWCMISDQTTRSTSLNSGNGTNDRYFYLHFHLSSQNFHPLYSKDDRKSYLSSIYSIHIRHSSPILSFPALEKSGIVTNLRTMLESFKNLGNSPNHSPHASFSTRSWWLGQNTLKTISRYQMVPGYFTPSINTFYSNICGCCYFQLE